MKRLQQHHVVRFISKFGLWFDGPVNLTVLAILAIVGGAIFGFQLGLWFMVAMVGLAGASILWTTSRVLREFPEDRYVGAALELFASVALMFYYLLMIFAGSRR